MPLYKLSIGDIAKEMVMGCLTDEQYEFWKDADPNRLENHLIHPVPGEVDDDVYIGPWHECNDLFSLYAAEFNSDNTLIVEEIDENGKPLNVLIDMDLGDISFMERTFTTREGYNISFDLLDNGITDNFFFGEAVFVGDVVSCVFQTDDFVMKDIEFAIHSVEGEEFITALSLRGEPLINHLTERKVISYCFMLNCFKN